MQKLKEKIKSKLVEWLYNLLSENMIRATTNLYTSNSITVGYKKLDPRAKDPDKAHADDAGLDLYALERTYIPAGQWRMIRTGLAFDIPLGWHMQLHTRSSYAKLMVRNHLGIIDSGYRGEVLVIVYNNGYEDFIVEAGSKFCQALLLPVPCTILLNTDKLSESIRGEKGFGSSGR